MKTKKKPSYLSLKRQVGKLERSFALLSSRNSLLEISTREDTSTISNLRSEVKLYKKTNARLHQGIDSLRTQIGIHERIMDWTARCFGKHADMMPPLVEGENEDLMEQRQRRDFQKERTDKIGGKL